ncbi:MAG: hypothetical protein HYS32_02250 [Candidatus Woesearchaeota archaeon]|nr:MAG: hypothetical protein HYS32_02250 [Candidatus Woesearchaeota archaeon]
MSKKRGFLVLIALFLLLVTVPVFAETFNAEKGYQWLNSKAANGSWSDKVFDTALSVIALQEAGLTVNAEAGANWLLTQQDPEGCFPKGNCQVRETAFALLALDATNKDTAKVIKWLVQDAQTPTPTIGKWWLQIASTASGSCTISYIESNITFSQNISLDNQKVTNCNNQPWLDLRACLSNNPLARNPSMEFDVSCNSLPGSPILSLIFNRVDAYYIVQEEHKSTALIDVDSGCWGNTKRSSCDYETTLYVAYALNKVGAIPSAIIWLRDNYQSSVVLHNSFLALTTKRSSYVTELVKLQQETGSWNNNIYQTAFSILALDGTDKQDQRSKAIGWLKSQQKSDGSWNQNVVDTALALFSGFSTETVSCGDGFCDSGEDTTCPTDCKVSGTRGTTEQCANNDDDDGDSFIDCDDPDCSDNPSCGQQEICDDSLDNDDDSAIDCDDNDCRFDLLCGGETEICNDGLDNDEDSFVDCDDDDCDLDATCISAEEEGGGLGWLIFLIILLLIITSLFVFYKKNPEKFKKTFSKENLKKIFTKEFWKNLFKKKPKQPERGQPLFTMPQQFRQQNYQQQYRPYYGKRSKTEEDLSESVKEARKLLGKK